MTGSRTLHCLFCRLLRVVEINRRIYIINRFRLPTAAVCTNTRRALSTSHWLLDIKSKDSDSTSSSSDSSSSDEYSSGSSGSESDSDQEVKESQSMSTEEKTDESPVSAHLLTMLQASEKKWGPETDLLKKLKDMEKTIDTTLVTEAQKLSETLPGDTQKTESDLLGQLLTQFDTTAKQKDGAEPKAKHKTAAGLSDILQGLKIQKTKRYSKHTDQEKYKDNFRGFDEDKVKLVFKQEGSGLFSGTPLGIFSKDDMKSADTEMKGLFEIVEEEDKGQLQFYPPNNAFEEQIQWTREGKLWTFPIDNEAGWEEEKNVEFYEHVLLDNQILDFPKKGPIRHFMELVTTALSKNPYLTVEQKHEHIDWYRKYFAGKQDILEERLGQDGLIISPE